MKRDLPPTTPYREKQRAKKTRPGYFSDSLRPRACARARYREAGAAADELIAILHGDPARDRATWAYYCYHHDIGILFDRACELASMQRQGELRNAVTAFQRWLQKNYKEAR